MTQDEIDKAWSQHIASLSVHTLVQAGIVAKTDLDRALEIVAEEVLVRLSFEDRPNAENWRYKPK